MVPRYVVPSSFKHVSTASHRIWRKSSDPSPRTTELKATERRGDEYDRERKLPPFQSCREGVMHRFDSVREQSLLEIAGGKDVLSLRISVGQVD